MVEKGRKEKKKKEREWGIQDGSSTGEAGTLGVMSSGASN